jgi:predicted O-methyltransferase YrrM
MGAAKLASAALMALSWEETAARIHAIPEGTCSEPEAEYLHDLSLATEGRGAVVEIGTYVGKTTIALAHGQIERNGRPVDAIDIVRHHDLDENLRSAGVADFVQVRIGRSAAVARAWSEPIELLWIDGDHSYRGVRTDIRAWADKVMPGGTIAFHDYPGVGWTRGPARAIRHALVSDPDHWRVVSDREHGSIFALERTTSSRDDVPFARRVRERAVYTLKTVPSETFLRIAPRTYERLRDRARRG